MRMIELVLIWWGFWMIVKIIMLCQNWSHYRQMYHISTGLSREWYLWFATAVHVLVCPIFRIWKVFKPLFVVQQYKVQIEIFRYDGQNAKVQSEVPRVPDGIEIATKLIDGDRTISAIYYQVVTIHEAGVIEARTKR